jgi:hypothetical protein
MVSIYEENNPPSYRGRIFSLIGHRPKTSANRWLPVAAAVCQRSSLQPVKWWQSWPRCAHCDVNWGGGPALSTVVASVVVWTTRQLGLEMAMAFRGRRRYGTSPPPPDRVRSGSSGATHGDSRGCAKSCLSTAGATNDDSCGGVKSCLLPVGATYGGSYGGDKSCLELLDRRWCYSDGR